MNKSELINKLQQILPEQAILTKPEQLAVYECDGLSAYRQPPLLVVLPNTVEQIQQILQICYQAEIPIVARGSGTGLSGGALPLKQGILLSLAKLKQILAIDVQNRTAVVQPGVRNLAISEAVAPYHLYYAPDPSSQIACSIGGNVAENSGGVHCLKYGLTVHNIQQIKILTIEGELLTLGSSGLDNAGFDLLALFHGSEGLLGIIVEITVKLLPKPDNTQTLLAGFNKIEQAGEAVAAIISSGIIPAGLEMMDKLSIQAAEDFIHPGYPQDVEAILICELDGQIESVNQQLQQTQKILKQYHADPIKIATTATQRQKFWLGRKSAFPAVGRLAPDYYCMDGTIPRKHLAPVLQQIAQWSEEYQLPVANVFHAGDGNLHPLILYDANQAGELEKAEQLGEKILSLCVDYGGTVTGEHGVGIEKLNPMCHQFQPNELTMFHAIKQCFDPKNLLNPGKAIPTLQRCAELGAMHVHHNQLPFPELERF